MQYKIGSYGKTSLGDSLIKSMYALLSPNAAATTIRDLINLDKILENTQDNTRHQEFVQIFTSRNIAYIFLFVCVL